MREDKDTKERIRMGIVGVGVMGLSHARYLLNNEVPNTVLTAVCDIKPERLKAFEDRFGKNESVHMFEDYNEMYKSGLIDAVLIVTPHYDHPKIAADAFQRGLNVLVEKPAGVYTKQVLEMNEAAERSGKVFGIMLCMRADPVFKKVRDIVKSGELGVLKRFNWTITTWYRPQCYHDLSSWRSTWKDEGGGLLINQCPHNLDLLQWIMGMPAKVHSFVKFGKYYDIEVEDEVTAFFEYENGLSGTFIASTGETPGTNRLEIAGDMGNLIVEGGSIRFLRNRIPEREFNKSNKKPFGQPEFWECNIPVKETVAIHAEITRNFSNAIISNEKLIAPGVEGIRELEISNAIHLSAWTESSVTLPIDHEKFYAMLKERVNQSTYTKKKGEKI